MTQVLALAYHGIGHLNPFISICRSLEAKEFTTVIAAAQYFEGYVREQRQDFYPLASVPFGLNLEKWVNQIAGKRNLYFAELRDRWNDSLYQARRDDLLKLVHRLKPEIILIDAMLATDFIVLYPFIKQHGLRVAIVHAMLPTEFLKNTPAINSLSTSANSLGNFLSSGKRLQWCQRLKFFGMSDSKIIRRRVKRSNLPSHYLSNKRGILNFYLQNLPEIILCPADFELESRKRPIEDYVGFPASVQVYSSRDAEYMARRKEIMEWKIKHQRPLIYCSFGTVETRRHGIVQIFLRRLIDIASREGYQLVISTSEELENIPQGVFHFKSVYQTDLLEITDLFISHGGINSIAEAIDSEVPLLIYPIHPQLDPRGNALRVWKHQLGLIGDIDRDTEKDLSEKIHTLLSESIYRQQLKRFKMLNHQYRKSLLKRIEQLPQIVV